MQIITITATTEEIIAFAGQAQKQQEVTINPQPGDFDIKRALQAIADIIEKEGRKG